MPKITILVDTRDAIYGQLLPGQVVDVEQDTSERWKRLGIAGTQREVASAPGALDHQAALESVNADDRRTAGLNHGRLISTGLADAPESALPAPLNRPANAGESVTEGFGAKEDRAADQAEKRQVLAEDAKPDGDDASGEPAPRRRR